MWSLSIPLRVLLPAQPELVMPGLEVVQRVATRHLLETAEPEADESHGGAVTLNRHFGLGSRPRYSPALPVAGPGVSVRRRRLAQPHRGGQFPFPIRLNFRKSILVLRYLHRTGEVPSYSLNRTRYGMALGPPAGVVHHPSSGPSATPALSAQLKR